MKMISVCFFNHQKKQQQQQHQQHKKKAIHKWATRGKKNTKIQVGIRKQTTMLLLFHDL